MARSYARVMTAIWRDKDFRGLSGVAQRVYLLLVTQADISAAGTLPLRVRRWADLAKDTTTAEIAAGLTELTETKFVVADKTTEELLVRSFVKWDGGSGNPKRRKVIEHAASEVVSSSIKRTLVVEFKALGLPTDALSDTDADSLSDAVSGIEPDSTMSNVEVLTPESALSQVDSLSDSVSDALSTQSRVAVGYVSTSVTTTHNPQHATQPSDPSSAQRIVAGWIDGCRKRPPKNVIGQIAKNVKGLLEEGLDPADVHAGLQEWARKGNLHPATLPSIVNEVMNHSQQLHPTDASIARLLGGRPLRSIPGGAS